MTKFFLLTICLFFISQLTFSQKLPQLFPRLPENLFSGFQNPDFKYKPEIINLNIDSTEFATEIPQEKNSYFDNLIAYAKKFLGVRYRYAGYSAYGFDCSGFTSFVYSKFGQNLSRSAVFQAIQTKNIPVSHARKGDLIFFRGRNWRSPAVGHVGLVISNPGEKLTFIHSSCDKGINIEIIDAVYYKPRFIKVCRVIE